MAQTSKTPQQDTPKAAESPQARDNPRTSETSETTQDSVGSATGTSSRASKPSPQKTATPPEKTYGGMTRRTLCLGIGGAAVLLGLGGLKFVGAKPITRPPGGQDEALLISACIRCEKCYEICPRNVIAPAHVEDGFVNMRTPTFNFSANYCDWCTEENGGKPLCVAVCPTEALKLPADATPENVIIGKALITEDWCLAYKLIGCRFCYDACPYEAMGLDDNDRPYVIEDKCNGCGACESVCVSLQNGSISQGATARAIIIHPVAEL